MLPVASTSSSSSTPTMELHALFADELQRGLNFLGGKREPEEPSHLTAAREFTEETGNVLRVSAQHIAERLQQVWPTTMDQRAWIIHEVLTWQRLAHVVCIEYGGMAVGCQVCVVLFAFAERLQRHC
jgi:hypothetical protein